MVALIHTVAFQGVTTNPIETQVHIAGGLPAFNVVGLPDKAVGESRERVRAALNAVGLSLPAKRITVNLSPADVPKAGSHFDLPIALGLLTAMGIFPQEWVDGYVVLGELALDGRLSPVSGILPAAMHASQLEKGIICPASNGPEAAWAGEELDILAPDSLLALVNHHKGQQLLTQPRPPVPNASQQLPDLKDVRGQEQGKRLLEVAAAGGHNMLMCGPPGAGKSMLAARLPSILPPLTPTEALEVSTIHSVAGMLQEGRLLDRRPYRDPHHSASLPALVGGGIKATPGEISLSHNGVLFLDELPEFQRATLEALRQPLETGETTIARVNAHVTYPARFQLIAAMNPCKCGYLSDPDRMCRRAPRCGSDYQDRLSGPLLDRIDLFIDMPPVAMKDLTAPADGEDSATVLNRVQAARDIQTERYKDVGIRTNAEASGDVLYAAAKPDTPGEALLNQAVERMKLSARGYNRILRVARTIADMEGGANVNQLHIAEAVSYREWRQGVLQTAA